MNEELIKDLTEGIEVHDFKEKYCNGNYKEVGTTINKLIFSGLNIQKKVNSVGDIGFILAKDNVFTEQELLYDTDNVKVLIISDLHIGGIDDGLKYINDVYKYAKDNDIHIIFNIGDLFHGINVKYPDNGVQSFFNQLDRFKKEYPMYDDIVTFLILGNHDYSIFQTLGIDISKCINDRTDFINLGYGLGKIKLGNDLILLEHDLLLTEQPQREQNARFIFRGHSHKYESVSNQITVPALQDADFYTNLTSVGFCEAEFFMNEGSVKYCNIKQFDFKDGIRFINQMNYAKKSQKVKKITI